MPQTVKFPSQHLRSFDAAYYRRFYLDAATRAISKREIASRVAVIGAILKQLDVPVKRILDVGCGLGWYEGPLLKMFRNATYVGTEFSEYLCELKGWTRGSIVDLKFREKFDLVICSDVMQYLNTASAERGISNLARLSRGAIYFHALTKGDWAENVDRSGTDGDVHLRSAAWYRRALREHFVHVGCGVHLRNQFSFAQLELEEPWR